MSIRTDILSLILSESLAAVTTLEPSEVISISREKEFRAAAQLLQVNTPDKMENISRLLFGRLITSIPAEFRIHLTDLLKKIRNPSKELASLDPLSGPGNLLLSSLKPYFKADFYGLGKRFVLALSHDVDTRIGYKFVPKMAEDLKSRGLTSSFYFLTHADYQVDQVIIRELIEEGFEVGLHGMNHDVGIGMRSRSYIRNWLEQAIIKLGIERPGFRSPGLSVSRVLMEELNRAGFLYDSSLQYGCSFYSSTGYSLPFRLAGLQILEIPIWFQDAFLFRDAEMSSEDALTWCRDQITRLSGIRAVVVLLLHPDIMVHHQQFWRSFLDYLSDIAIKDALVCPLRQVVELFKN